MRRNFLITLLLLLLVTLSHAQENTLATVIAQNPNFSSFNRFAGDELAQLDASSTNYLVFAPTNSAFDALPPFVLAYLRENPELLARVIRYHIAQDNAGTLLSLDGSPLDFVGVAVDSVSISEEIATEQGTIYVIDSLIFPEIALPTLDYAALSGAVHIEGSSTVSIISQVMLEDFASVSPEVQVTNNPTGTSDGFQVFCGLLGADLLGATRPARAEEADLCQINGIIPLSFFLGTDVVAVLVNGNNSFIDSLSQEQLAFVFSDPRDASGAVLRPRLWSDINSEWPAEPIKRYMPAADRGTFNYFAERIFQPIYDGIADGSLNLADYDFYSPVDFVSDELVSSNGTVLLPAGENLHEAIAAVEDLGDLTLVDALAAQEAERFIRPLLLSQERVQEDDYTLLRSEIAQDTNAIGFVSFSYSDSNVRAIAVDNVEASVLNINQGNYPLSRLLYIVSDADIIQRDAALSGFIHFYLSSAASNGLPEGFFPSSLREQRFSNLKWLAANALGN